VKQLKPLHPVLVVELELGRDHLDLHGSPTEHVIPLIPDTWHLLQTMCRTPVQADQKPRQGEAVTGREWQHKVALLRWDWAEQVS
jgi:hypothetical protein